jgi:cyclic pyranopterin phosphate synthase
MLTTSKTKTQFSMVDIHKKETTFRRAIAMGTIHVGEKAFTNIKNRTLPKGDALVLAEIAGITGAKKTYDIIPLCHPLGLDHVGVHTELHPETHAISAYCVASTSSKTGVEMEAINGVNCALMTIYDLAKMITPTLLIDNIKLLFKEGGKSGTYYHPDGIPAFINYLVAPEKENLPLKNIKTTVITLSDRAAAQTYDDVTGPTLTDALTTLGAENLACHVIPDDKSSLTNQLLTHIKTHAPHIIFTNGGTGLSPTDITAKALTQFCDKLIPGISELLRAKGAAQFTPFAWLSEGIAGIKNNTLIISFPGKPSAALECLQLITPLLPHTLRMIKGGAHD